ncbi:M28 family peptidase [bacterium]|nr:MAG: M28 family peptidase [bacterium]
MSLLAVLALTTPPASIVSALKEHVQFLASDTLAGRATPSPELDMAAEYIATRLSGAGAKPGVGESFFQIAIYREKPVRNVVAVIKGTDPKFVGQYVLVTAHYDHLGTRPSGEGDRINNGANDNASGVASMIETARLLAVKPPKRNVAFIAFWGEERGLLGSTYYGKNPVFPLKDTIADINLEQMGRTDDSEQGDRKLTADITGAKFSEVSKILADAFKAKGLKLNLDAKPNEAYFVASDNAALALAGVPAHTLSVAYEFPDYHKPADEWPKLDYVNLASLTLGVAEGVKRIADLPTPPKWSEIPQTERFRKARNGE